MTSKRAEHFEPGEIIVVLDGRVIDNFVLPSHCIVSWKRLRPDPTPEQFLDMDYMDQPTHTLTCDLDHEFEIATDWKTGMIQQSIALAAKARSQDPC